MDEHGVCYAEVDDGQGGTRPLADRGFEWGVSGAGLPELAATILRDALGDDRADPRRFVVEVLAVLPAGRWTLSQQQIEAWTEGRPWRTA